MDGRQFYVKKSTGHEVIIGGVPANAKITFGKVQPGAAGFGGYCLRIYETESKQIAVITDVVEFWDMALTVQASISMVVADDNEDDLAPTVKHVFR